jgi:hypothetical protein
MSASLVQSWLTVCDVQLDLHYYLHATSALSILLHHLEAGALCCCTSLQTLQKGIIHDTSIFLHDKVTKKSPNFNITFEAQGWGICNADKHGTLLLLLIIRQLMSCCLADKAHEELMA